MDYTFGKSKSEIEQLQDAVAHLEQAYHCDWSDAVHESYCAYVVACKNIVWEIEQVMREIEANCSRLQDINPDRLVYESAEVCRKVSAY